MTAYVECQVCGGKLMFDTNVPVVSPESLGWRELPKWQVSFKAQMECDLETGPVCPRCLKSHAELAEALFKDFDPFGG